MEETLLGFNVPNRRGLTGIEFEILLVFKNESHCQVNNQRRTKSNEGGIDKGLSYTTAAHAQPFTPPGAYTKSATFKKKLNFLYHDRLGS